MSFVQHCPAPPLHDSILAIWDWRAEPGAFRLERILPSPGAGIIVNLLEDQTRVCSDDSRRYCERTGGSVFSGQATRSFLIDTAEQIAVMGVVFRSGAAARFLREPMHRLSDRHVALDDLGANDVGGLRERLLDTADAVARIDVLQTWLRARFTPAALHPAINYALRALGDRPQVARIGDLIEASGYSPRRFGSLFRDQVGIGPKRYARLQRFRAVVASAQGDRRIEWLQVAADCGFHDQPHLVREFRTFAGMTPSQYLTQRGTHVNHIALP